MEYRTKTPVTNMKNALNERVDEILSEYKDKNEHETKFKETLKELRTYEPSSGELADEEKLRVERRKRMKSSPTVKTFEEEEKERELAEVLTRQKEIKQKKIKEIERKMKRNEDSWQGNPISNKKG